MRAHWILLVTLLPGVGLAQNLLVSSDFDAAGDVAAWPDPFPDPEVTISWEPPPMDVDSSPSSGSLKIETSISNGSTDGPEQCVAAGTSVPYEVEGWVFSPTQVPQPFPLIAVDYFSSSGCTGFIDSDVQFPTSELDTWKPIQFIAISPPGTGSIGFRPLSGNTTVATPVAVFFDALFIPEPAPLPGLAAGLCLLVALRRRLARRGALRER